MVGVVSRQIRGIETVYGGCSELTDWRDRDSLWRV